MARFTVCAGIVFLLVGGPSTAYAEGRSGKPVRAKASLIDRQSAAEQNSDDRSDDAIDPESAGLEELFRRKIYLESRIDALRDAWAASAANLQGYLAVATQHVNFGNGRSLPIAIMGTTIDAKAINTAQASVILSGGLRRQLERNIATEALRLTTVQQRGKAAEDELSAINARLPPSSAELSRRLQTLDERLDALQDQWGEAFIAFQSAYAQASKFINFRLPSRPPTSRVFQSPSSRNLDLHAPQFRLSETSEQFRQLIFDLASAMTQINCIEGHGERVQAERLAIQKRLKELGTNRAALAPR